MGPNPEFAFRNYLSHSSWSTGMWMNHNGGQWRCRQRRPAWCIVVTTWLQAEASCILFLHTHRSRRPIHTDWEGVPGSTWACENFHRELCGLALLALIIDHKSLETLIPGADHACQHLLLRLLWFNPVAEYVPGKNWVIAQHRIRLPVTHRHCKGIWRPCAHVSTRFRKETTSATNKQLNFRKFFTMLR